MRSHKLPVPDTTERAPLGRGSAASASIARSMRRRTSVGRRSDARVATRSHSIRYGMIRDSETRNRLDLVPTDEVLVIVAFFEESKVFGVDPVEFRVFETKQELKV